MAEITASMVKELREKTDAPMMECKKALAEAGGDMGKAEEILRVKLGNKATKAAARIAAEGVVAIHVAGDGKLGSIFEINSETDFVAKNDDFIKLAADCARLVAEKAPADVAALSALPLGEGTVESTRTALVGKIGENMSIRRFVRVEAKGRLNSYIHGGSQVGAMVELSCETDFVAKHEEFVALAREIAMHAAATRPLYVKREEVRAEDMERMRATFREEAKEKPEAVREKIVEGKLASRLSAVVLLEQPYIKDDTKTIQDLLNAAVQKFGERTEVRRLAVFSVRG